MNDQGRNGDLFAKDGIYGANVTIDTSRLKPDTCLKYEALVRRGRACITGSRREQSHELGLGPAVHRAARANGGANAMRLFSLSRLRRAPSSRFHRERKQKIARRLRNQQMLKSPNEKGSAAKTGPSSHSKVVSE